MATPSLPESAPITTEQVAQHSPQALHGPFLEILPTIETHAKIYFRHLKCPGRKADAIQETIAVAWKWYVRARCRGKDPAEFVSTLATYAARHVRSGRKLCGQEKARDVLSPRAQQRKGFEVEALACSTRCMSDVPLPAPDGAATETGPGPAQAPPGPGRPSWSGLLQLGLLAVPVKAYPATASAPELPGHQLHAGCGRRLRHDKRCPEHGPVDAGAVVKGYEYAPGRFLVLDEAELDRLRPARDRALALDCFLDPGRLDPALFSGRALYLVPDGPAARPAYAVLAHALRQRRRGALGRLVLSGRRRLALVRPAGLLLALHLLHYPAQLRSPAALEADLRLGPVGEAEARLADALVDAYSRPVRWADYRDDSAEGLAALVEAQLRGDAPAQPAPEGPPALGLLEALRRSVAALPLAPAPGAAGAGGAGGKKTTRRRPA